MKIINRIMSHNKIIIFALFVISMFAITNSQCALYNGGDFMSSLFTPMTVPGIPYSLDQVNAILSSAPIDNGTGINNAAPIPCIFIGKGQNVGYRLVATQSSGYAFLPSLNLCPCNTCFRVITCCGPIRNSDGTVTPCYSPVACQGNGTCLRNYECYGVSDTVSHVSSTDDLKSYVNSVSNIQVSTPCFKISPAMPGSNGFMFKTITSGVGLYVTSCNSTSTTTSTTACLKLQPCCSGGGRSCYTATPCCVPLNGTQSKDCLSVTRCDVPN